MKALGVCACILLAFSVRVAGQSAEGSLDWFDTRAKEAISQSNYESALKILTDAQRKFPRAPRLNVALGDLYYDKELFPLALEQYRLAEKKGTEDFHTLDQIARSLGKLNREKESIEYLTRILSHYPDSVETIDDLGWMYFKTYQLEKGEKVLLDGIKKFGMQRSMAMTLGTIYSGMNRYNRSREYYMKSIDDALKADDRYFASIAYYNLSLLEHGFFHYNSSLAYTEDSIDMEDRASGHLAKGELLQSQMDYRGALAEYEKSFERDATPLTKENLAILNQRFGQLDLARRYAEEALGAKDLAWMLYYGTDVDRHYKDIHETLVDIYNGLATVEATKPTAGLGERVAALVAALRYKVMAWYHKERFRVYSLSIGRQFQAEGRVEESYWEFFKATEGYREVAASYLEKARSLETARTPHAEVFYVQERGKLEGSVPLLESSLSGFDQFWEREAAMTSLVAMIPLLSGRRESARRREALSRLWDIDPGAFRQHGLGLPLRLEVKENRWGAREKRLIVRYLKRAGSQIREGPAPAPGDFRFSLSLELGPGRKARFTLRDGAHGRVIGESSREYAGGARERSARLVQSVLEDLYSVH